jgi:hypothetical protein
MKTAASSLCFAVVLWTGGVAASDGGGTTARRPQSTPPVASDFNGDGFADLAVAVPTENVGSVKDAGAVQVLYGSAGGVQATSPDDQLWTQGGGVQDQTEANDRFGWSLAEGDFNGDGFGDLAIGIPYEDVGTVVNGGAVEVLYGSAAGLQAVSPDDQFWTEDILGNGEQSLPQDLFGYALAAGDVNGDGYADLAVSAPWQEVDTFKHAGGVDVVFGSADGLQTVAPVAQHWTQDSPDVEDQAHESDLFGWGLSSADYNSDGFADLAIGVPLDDPEQLRNAGVVNVLYGSPNGLQTASPEDQLWTQDSPGVPDDAERTDEFGTVLESGDFNGDGFADLAVEATSEDVGDIFAAGAFNVLYGSALGLQGTQPPAQWWNQDSPDVQDQAEELDRFGWALAAGDFNGDGFTDIAAGVRFEDIDQVSNAGAVNVLYGSPLGLQAILPDDQFWYQGSPDVGDVAEANDRFGYSVGAADFNGDGYADLAVGAPGETVGTFDSAGQVNVLYGSIACLQAVSPDDQVWVQGSNGVQDQAEAGDRFGFAIAKSG